MHRDNGSGKVAAHVNVALWVYAFLVASVTAASWFLYKRSGDPLTRPLCNKVAQFQDLTNYAGKTAHLVHGAAALGLSPSGRFSNFSRLGHRSNELSKKSIVSKTISILAQLYCP